ncbi:MinD/ParA family protein [Oricola cellulosilytica]|uniref:Response regulatory domain-containing protein n=1 Tax=Oricola cellulosilytica TaxID=1429082 RepID=A0A4V2MP40_9HYPH|nr:MinD/ParA family protein [Oricola cellulosilytica]TCD16182.1 hypothetical protein E0D97_01740 [Oricola cellulosilytica]
MNINVSSEGKSRIIVYSTDPKLIKVVDAHFSKFAAYEYEAEPLATLLKKKKFDADHYDLVIMDLSDGAVLEDPSFPSARALVKSIPVIFVSDALTNERMRRVVRLDGEDWLLKPIDRRALVEAIAAQIQKLKTGTKKVHAVLSCGGGAGGTTLSIMLAYFLSRAHKRRRPKVAIFDVDFLTAAVAAYLNVENAFDLRDVINHPERVDLQFADIIKKRQESGFSVFSFENPEIYLDPKGVELVLRLLDVISFEHDHTVIDIPVQETAWKQQILKAVDTITLVANATVPAIQYAKATSARVRDIADPNCGIFVVVNRAHTGLFGGGIGKKEIAGVFGDQKVVILPDERKVMAEAQNRGVLPVEVSPRSKFCKGVDNLAASLWRTER